MVIKVKICCLTLMLSLFLYGCSTEDNNTIVKSIDSPNGNYTAVAFIRDLGATTDYSPQVSIIKKGRKLLNQPGNVFIGDKSKQIDISWQDDNTLIIFVNCAERDIHLQLTNYKNLNIEYKKITEKQK